MILNNIKILPKDASSNLPTANPQKNYGDFYVPIWSFHIPNLVIVSENKCCGNHKIQVLKENFDVLPIRVTDFGYPINAMSQSNILDKELQEFFKALALFQRFFGFYLVEPFDYAIEGKVG